MHPNPSFRQTPRETALAAARARGFGLLTINGDDGPVAAHVPFVLSPDGARIECHLVRSNPLARALSEARQALLAVSGPDAYISPDWYRDGHDQVPTWNYVAVHLRGALRLLETEALRPHLERLSAEFERRLAPKPEWRLDKISDEFYAKLSRMIVPAEMEIASLDSTFKANQNKPDAARLAAAEALEALGLGAVGSASAIDVAGLMRGSDAEVSTA